MNSDFSKIKRSLQQKHGAEKGTEVFWKWINKHGYDETKPMGEQKSKANAIGGMYDPFLELFDDPEELEDLEPTPEEATKAPAEGANIPLGDPMDKKTDSDQYGTIPQAARVEASDKKKGFISVGQYKVPYVAAPKFEGKDGPIIVKAIVLEEGVNINGWRVVANEFQRVAEQYKAGRQLRLNHDKTVQAVIGKSFNGLVLRGADIQTYLGSKIEGTRDDGLYVAAEFEANPQDLQVRTNILQGYCEYGSIGLDANAYCEECSKPIEMGEDGSMKRECRHFDAPVKLMNVDVKEYSYVAEPAYPHSIITPTFSAAVLKSLGKGESSLSKSPINVTQEMSAPNVDAKVAVAAKAEGDGKKAEGDADALATYKMGYADAFKNAMAMMEKFRAGAKAEEEKKPEETATVEATASAKTDQIGKVAQTQTKTPAQSAKEELLNRVWFKPTESMINADPATIEMFAAAVKHPDAPPELKNKFRGMFK